MNNWGLKLSSLRKKFIKPGPAISTFSKLFKLIAFIIMSANWFGFFPNIFENFRAALVVKSPFLSKSVSTSTSSKLTLTFYQF